MSEAVVSFNRRVLIVDDDRAVIDLYLDFLAPRESEEGVQRFLEGLDTPIDWESEEGTAEAEFEIDIAVQGQEALQLVQQAVEGQRPYAVIFIDMRMPPGWDGLTTARRIREVDDDVYHWCPNV